MHPDTLRRLVALVPVRGLEAAKARLGEALDAEERRALVEGLLRRTIAAAMDAPGIARVVVVSPDPAVRRLAVEAGADPAEQRSGGLNQGLALARAEAVRGGADGVLVIPADLPAVTPAELARVIEAARGSLAAAGRRGDEHGAVVALVTDRSGDGTNLLLLAPPGIIPFRFGPGSRSRHQALAGAAGAVYVELDGPLELDLDTPDDLLLAEAAGLGAVRAEVP